MVRIGAVKAELLERKHTPDPAAQRLPRRQGTVVAAVTGALELAEQPLRVSEIHAAVEELLGAPVAYSTVKEALSAHARARDGRFRRICRGCYELS